ncbi:MAG TPA: hypothetical protein DD614_00065 [Clostridiales bacterium]|nr:hypothetical protein [Clostridiales bacterium]
MEILKEVTEMCTVKNCQSHGPAVIPQEGHWDKVTKIEEVSGFTHGCGTCAPQQGTCKLSLNIKNGIIEEALVETIGCSGMTQSAAMASETLPGKTLLEALNTDLVCDAINDAMKHLFLQIVYGRTQSAFSDNGLPVGSALDDLGKNRSSLVGTHYSTKQKGTRYLQTAEGYTNRLALDENDEIIGYEYINLNNMMRLIKGGKDVKDAYNESIKTYGRFDEGVKFIDPRKE